MFGFVSLFSPKFWCPDASWVSGSLNLYLMLLLRSREFFIFQIADVHLLHSATWWRLLGQKYLWIAEITGMKLFGTDPVQRRVIRFVIQMKSSSMSVKADGNRKRARKPLI